jgi:hypothetical protein
MITNYNDASDRAGRAGHIRNNTLCKRISRSAPAPVAEVRTITITSVSNSTEYAPVIDGETLSYTTPASGNTTSTRAEQLYQAAIGNETLAGRYIIDVDAVVVTLTRREAGNSFSITAAADSTVALVTAASEGTSVAPGLIVCEDDGEQAQLAAPNTTQEVWNIIPASPNASDTIHLTITGDFDGDGTVENYSRQVAAGADVQATVEAIQSILEDISGITVTEDDTKVVVTSDLGGVPFTVDSYTTGGNGTTCAAARSIAAGQSRFVGRPLGVVLLEDKHELPAGGGLVTHAATEQLSVGAVGEYDALLDGDIAVAAGDPVYVVTGGSGTKGAVRNDSDSGNATLLDGASFLTANFTGLDNQKVAGIALNLAA